MVRGSAVNNDGRSLGIMAPNPDGQRAVLVEAYRRAGLSPERLSLIEAHGTGTLIGDPIEVRALADALGASRERALGSVKASLGHLMAAAGIAGLIKVVLALRQRTLPPVPFAERANPRLELSSRKLRLLTSAEPWAEPSPRVASVSAFGFGGTNAHVVLEEAPPASVPPSRSGGPELLLLSAPTAEHLAEHAAHVVEHLERSPSTELAGTAATLQGRTHYRFRMAASVDDVAHARSLLEGPSPAVMTGRADQPPRMAFLFPGQGSQHAYQARGLLKRWPSLRARVLELLDGVGARAAFDACWTRGDREALRRTDVAQPLLFAFQVALTEAVARAGLRPSAVIGHSVGEIAALACAGVLDVEEALRWVHERGSVMQAALPPGVMAAVLAPVDEVKRLLQERDVAEGVGIAAVNGPRQTVIAGAPEAVRRLCLELDESGLVTRTLPTAHAFHSPLVDDLLPALRDALPPLSIQQTAIDVEVISTVRAEAITPASIDHEYLITHARETVRFADAMRVLASRDVDAFLEVGPGNTLSRLARAGLEPADARPSFSLCRSAPAFDEGAPDDQLDVRAAHEALATLYVRGADIDLGPLEGTPPSERAPLLPWRRERLRLGEEPPVPAMSPIALGERPGPSLQRRVWRPFVPSTGTSFPAGDVRLFGAPGPLRDLVAQALQAKGRGVLFVEPGGPGLARVAEDRFAVDPRSTSAVRWLLEGSRAASSLFLFDDDAPLDEALLRLAAWQGATSALSSSGPLFVLARARPSLAAGLRAAVAALRAEGVDLGALTLEREVPLARSLVESALLAGALRRHHLEARGRGRGGAPPGPPGPRPPLREPRAPPASRARARRLLAPLPHARGPPAQPRAKARRRARGAPRGHPARDPEQRGALLGRRVEGAPGRAAPGPRQAPRHADAQVMWIVQRPERFGVVLSSALIGDILSDGFAALIGGLGFAPSANVGVEHAIFEPAHGSAPRHATRSPSIVNPCATILAGAMLLEHVGENERAEAVRSAVARVVREGRVRTYDMLALDPTEDVRAQGAATTTQMGDAVIGALP